MELDSRIVEGKKPLTCFDVEQAKEFLGKECYFSNCKSHYKNLSAFEKYVSLTDHCIGTLTAVMDLGDRVFDVDQRCNEFRYCLPCEWVKPEEPKKKYRPFSLEEFLKIFDIGDQIDFKIKNYDEVKCAMFTGYITDVDRIDDKTPGAVELMLGAFHYSLFSLFEDFELFFEDKWQPFGIEEQV